MEEEETTKISSNRINRKSRPTQRFYVPPARRVVNKRNVNSLEINNSLKANNMFVRCNANDMINLNGELESTKVQQNVIGESICKIELNAVVVTQTQEDLKLNITEKCLLNSHEAIANVVLENLDIGNPEKSYSFMNLEDESGDNSKASQFVTNKYGSETVELQTFNISTKSEEDTNMLSIDTVVSSHLQSMSLTNSYYNTPKDETLKEQPHFYEDEDDAELKTSTNLYISFCTTSGDKSYLKKDNSDNEHNIQRTIENINRRSKPLIKHIRTDNTLQINTSGEQKYYSGTNNRHEIGSQFYKSVEETNLSNWEDMFDENGDIQKKYIGELSKHIGCDVKILKATDDCSSCHNMLLQDLDHVIELYDFPSSFKTQDIIQLYSDAYQDTMYVKWCDDTHALLVLGTPAQAQRALQIEHSIIKSRPLTAASKVASIIASCTDLKPAMKRPQTNMQTARRLINTHLGTKIQISKDILDQERKALFTAREQKRIVRQNEKDAWEGNPHSTKMV